MSKKIKFQNGPKGSYTVIDAETIVSVTKTANGKSSISTKNGNTFKVVDDAENICKIIGFDDCKTVEEILEKEK